MTDDEGGLIPWETFDADARNAGVIAVTLAAAYVRVHRPWLSTSRLPLDLARDFGHVH